MKAGGTRRKSGSYEPEYSTWIRVLDERAMERGAKTIYKDCAIYVMTRGCEKVTEAKHRQLKYGIDRTNNTERSWWRGFEK